MPSPPLAGRFARLLAVAVSLICGLAAMLSATLLGYGRIPGPHETALLLWAALGGVVAMLVYAWTCRRLWGRAVRLAPSDAPGADSLGGVVVAGLSHSAPLEDTLLYVAEQVRGSLALGRLSVWLRDGQRLVPIASDPQYRFEAVTAPEAALLGLLNAGARGTAWLSMWLPQLTEARGPADARLVAVTDHDQLLGVLLAEGPRAGGPLSPAVDQRLAEVAAQLGPVLRGARLDVVLSASMVALRDQARELIESRARLVSAADDARRRLERDLHDGAQQHLMGLALNLRLARELVRSDPDGGAELLGDLERASSQALDELRALCHGLYPAALSASGVVAALEAAAGRLSLAAYFDSELSARYPSEVEAAVYFVALEAMQNASKHAGPGVTVRVTIGERDQAIVLRVIDDGRGFVVGEVAGRGGLANLYDRVSALGGAVSVMSRPDAGTQVSATLPLRGEAGRRERDPVRPGTVGRL